MMFGADPEAFFIRGNDVVPADNFFEDGKKFGPREGPQLIRDGLAIEMRPFPAETTEDFLKNVRATLMQASDVAVKNDCILKIASCVPITRATLDMAQPDALKFGCDPDYNAWTETLQEITVDAANHYRRYAGGHIHIGSSNVSGWADCRNLCKYFDLFVGLSSVLLDRSKGSKVRRGVYGKCGSFRQQPHGFEYRVPSNFWLQSPIMAKAILELSEVAYNLWLDRSQVIDELEDSKVFNDSGISFGSSLADAINLSDAAKSMKILSAVSLLSDRYPKWIWNLCVYMSGLTKSPFLAPEFEWGFALSEDEYLSERLKTFSQQAGELIPGPIKAIDMCKDISSICDMEWNVEPCFA